MRDQLEEAIMRGDYEPGEKLPSERELSEVFGVSRVSIREAIRSLEAVGLVDVRHGHGTLVSDPAKRWQTDLVQWLHLHRDEVLDLLLVRGALDELAAARAAASADDQVAAQIRAAHEAFDAAARASEPDRDELSRLDIAFHTSIAQGSGSPLLTHMLTDMHQQLADSRRLGFEATGRGTQSAREHAAIMRGIEAGSPSAARRATRTHISHVRKLMERALGGS